MSSALEHIRGFLEWSTVRFLRSCARSRAFSLAVSALTSCTLWAFFSIGPRVTAVPLFISLSFTSALTLHSLASLFMSLYRPIICSVRLSINAEIILVFRSWWPRGLSIDEIKVYAVDTATESARAWYLANDGNAKKLSLSTDEAVSLTEQYLTTMSTDDRNESCPICLEKFDHTTRILKVCSHRYCLECISRWFARGRLCCPYCRTDHSVCVPTEIWEKRLDNSQPAIAVSAIDIISDPDE